MIIYPFRATLVYLKFLFMLVIVLLLWNCTPDAYCGNIIRDGEFENTSILSQAWNVTGLEASLDKTWPANGEYSLKLISNNIGKGVVSQVLNFDKCSPSIRIVMQMRYKLSGNIIFRVYLNNDGKKIELFASNVTKQDCWIPVQIEKDLKGYRASITLCIETEGKGIVWVDDIFLSPTCGPNLLYGTGFDGKVSFSRNKLELGKSQARKGFDAKFVNNCGRTDKYSLMIQANRDYDLNIFYPSITVPVKPNISYEFSAWMKGTGIPYKLCVQDAQNYSLMYFDLCETGNPVDGWTPVKLKFHTPASCRAVKLIMLRHVGYSETRKKLQFCIWVDDVELREAVSNSDTVLPYHHNVTVNISDKDKKPLNKILFGMNTGMGYLGKSDCEVNGEKFMMRYDDPRLAAAIKELGIDCLRWGGTSGNWWDWKNDWYFDMKIINYHAPNSSSINLTNFLERVSPKLWGAKKLWFDYYLGLCASVHIMPLICLNVNTDTPVALADLVKYIESRGFSGLDYEIGNELHGEKYVSDASVFVKAIREVSPNSKIGTTEEANEIAKLVERENWHDAWIPHYYYSEIPGDEHMLARHVFTDSEYMMSELYRRSVELHPGKKMWLTEWGWTPVNSVSREKTLLAALWNADVLMHQLDYSDVLEYSVYHSLFDVYFGILNYDEKGNIIRSVPFYSHKMFYNAIKNANQLLGVKITAMPLMYPSNATVTLNTLPKSQRGDDIPGLVARAVLLPDKSQRVLLLNRTKDYQHVKLFINGAVPQYEFIEQLAAKDYNDLFKVNGPTSNTKYRKFAIDRPVHEREIIKPALIEASKNEIILPPYSFTVIYVKLPAGHL